MKHTQEKTHSVYVILFNGNPIYIGKSQSPLSRMKRHRTLAKKYALDKNPVHRDYKTKLIKFLCEKGPENFEYHILKTFSDKKRCDNFEAQLIEEFSGDDGTLLNEQGGGKRGYKRSRHLVNKLSGKKRPIRPIMFEGERYDSLSLCARLNNCSLDKIKYRVMNDKFKDAYYADEREGEE